MGDSWTDELTDVPPQSDRKPPLLRRLWWSPRGRLALIAGVLMVTVAGLVVPVKLVVHGWQDASTVRGVGRGAGVFTVVSCVEEGSEGEDNKTYTCDGVFTRPGSTALPTTTHGSFEHGRPGRRLHAHIHADGSVQLGSNRDAAITAALWITYALATATTAALLLWFVAAVTLRGSDPFNSAVLLAIGFFALFIAAVMVACFLNIGFSIGYFVSG